MTDLVRKLRLPAETPLDVRIPREPLMQDFDRHGAPVPALARVHGAHSADADQPVDPVHAGERFAEAAKTTAGERIGGARHWDRGRLH